MTDPKTKIVRKSAHDALVSSIHEMGSAGIVNFRAELTPDGHLSISAGLPLRDRVALQVLPGLLVPICGRKTDVRAECERAYTIADQFLAAGRSERQ